MADDIDDFAKFCVNQVQRFSQYDSFRFMDSAAVRDYWRWLQRRCGNRQRVERLMDVAIERDEMPTIADLNRIFHDLFGADGVERVKEADPNCQNCGGTGWAAVVKGDIAGASRCACGFPPAFDAQRVMPSLPATEAKRLIAENRAFAEELAREIQSKVKTA